MTPEDTETRTPIIGTDGVWLEDVGLPPWMVWQTTTMGQPSGAAPMGNNRLADGGVQMQTTAREKRYNWQKTLGVALVLLLAAATGWLTAQAGLALTLRGVGAVMIPVALLVGIMQAGQKKIGWLATTLTLVLWALAAWGVWVLLAR